MAQDEFVRDMQLTIDKSRENRELSNKVILHSAEVRKTVGQDNWYRLKKEVELTIKQINRDGVTFADKDNAFTIINEGDQRSLIVTFEATSSGLHYEGTAQGDFRAEVAGDSITYKHQEMNRTKNVRFSIDKVSEKSQIEQIAGFMIACIIKG